MHDNFCLVAYVFYGQSLNSQKYLPKVVESYQKSLQIIAN